MYELPKLNYKFNELEPNIDSKTVEIHYTKHHQGYLDKLNKALENYPDLSNLDLEKLLTSTQIPEDILIAVNNNGNQVFNHNFYWESLTSETKDKKDKPEGKLLEFIARDFGSFDNLKKEFTDKALTLFGSGWVYLYLDKENKLNIKQYINEGNPLKEGIPLLNIDVWEHAYYLSYQNRRNEYIQNYFNIINWSRVEERLAKE